MDIPNDDLDTAPRSNPQPRLTESNVLKLILERIDALETFCAARFTDMDTRFTEMDNRFAGLERELRSINYRLAAFAEENNRIQGEQIEQRKRLDKLDGKAA